MFTTATTKTTWQDQPTTIMLVHVSLSNTVMSLYKTDCFTLIYSLLWTNIKKYCYISTAFLFTHVFPFWLYFWLPVFLYLLACHFTALFCVFYTPFLLRYFLDWRKTNVFIPILKKHTNKNKCIVPKYETNRGKWMYSFLNYEMNKEK